MQKEWTKAIMAKTIDHTLLKAIATEQSVRELCAEARKFGFATVCVNPVWVELCVRELSGTGILVCTVIGFPLGANASETKAAEAHLAAAREAREMDMVINVGAAKAGNWKAVEDVKLIRKAVGDKLQVKASGGIRSYHDGILMLDSGADRLGASSSIAVISELLE